MDSLKDLAGASASVVEMSRANMFRLSGSLDRQYLRTCAVHKLLARKRIGFARALELLAARNPQSQMPTMKACVEQWRANHLKEMLP